MLSAASTDVRLFEPFDSSAGFTTREGFAANGGDYLGIADGNGDGGADFGGQTPTGLRAYTGLDDNYLTGHNFADLFTFAPQTITWINIDITGLASIAFSADFAEFTDEISFADEGDFIEVAVEVDGGGFNTILSFRGVQAERVFRQDTDFDGLGDGPQLTTAAQTFGAAIPVTGSTLNLRISYDISEPGEDFGLDNVCIGDAVPPAGISGQKWNDLDGDGARDPGEPGLSGWVIELVDDQGALVASQTTADVDLDGNGTIDPETERGLYAFTGLAAGTYTVSEVLQPGWEQTSPGTHTVVLDAEEFVSGVDFGNRELQSEIHGQKWNDLDGDGERDPGEPGLNGWVIELFDNQGALVATQTTADVDLDGNGTIDPETERGLHAFTGLAAGTYTVSEVQQPGWEQTSLGPHTVMVDAGEIVTGIDFGNLAVQSEIHGQKWIDLDGDGARDPGEPGRSGWVIELYDDQGALVATQTTADRDVDGNGTIDPITERGLYAFTGLPAGSYTVSEVEQLGWEQTSPGRDTYYLIDTTADQLVSLDGSGNVNVIGSFGPADPESLAYDSRDGILYGLESTVRDDFGGGDLSDGIYTVDRTTGAATLLGSIPIDVSFGLTYNPLDDLLYSVTNSGQLVQINPETLSAVIVASPGPGTGGGALAYNPIDQRLYVYSNGTPRVYSYDSQTFAGPVIHANPTVGTQFYAMAFNGAGLVLSAGPAADENIYSYDRLSGATSPLFDTDLLNGFGVNGMVFIPAPVSGTGTHAVVLDVAETIEGIDFGNRNLSANDAFADRIDLGSDSSLTTTGNNAAFTGEPDEPAQSGTIASAWWSWTAPASGNVTIDTNGSGFDTVLTLATGSAVDALTVLGQDDDGGSGTQSLVTATVTAGMQLHIAVDGFDSETGAITLNLNFAQKILPPAVVVDDGETGYADTGDWQLSPIMEGLDGDVRFAPAGSGTRMATWTIVDLTPGHYYVSATWSAHPNRATNAPYTIRDGAGGDVRSIVLVNQQLAPADFDEDGRSWGELALVTITGTELVVELSNAANQYVIADAIRIEQTDDEPAMPPGTVIDDGEAGFSTTAGWHLTPITEGRHGDVRYTGPGDGSRIATWTFTGLAAGTYRVSATWSTHANRATDAPYTVYDGAVSLGTVAINQQQSPDDFTTQGSGWEELMEVEISAGTLVVELSNAADGFVIADAIRVQAVT